MSIVAIVGAGALGGAVAHKLAQRDRVREIRLVDTNDRVASGKALDIQQAGAVEPFGTTIVAYRDLHAVMGADVVVLSGPVAEAGEWTEEAGLALLARLAALNHHAVTICAGSGHRRLIERGVANGSLSRRRLIGSAPYAFQVALRAIVAVDLECSALDVSLTVLGALPERAVVPWSEASVRGVRLSRLLSPRRLASLQQKVPRVWPPGPYTLAAATARMCESIVQGTPAHGLPCCVVLDGELGCRGRAAAVTATLDRSGVAAVVEPSLTAQERVTLETALESECDRNVSGWRPA